MTTELKIKLPANVMTAVFEIANIRYYNALDYVDGEHTKTKVYNYEITIRHAENMNGKEMVKQVVKIVKSLGCEIATTIFKTLKNDGKIVECFGCPTPYYLVDDKFTTVCDITQKQFDLVLGFLKLVKNQPKTYEIDWDKL